MATSSSWRARGLKFRALGLGFWGLGFRAFGLILGLREAELHGHLV